MNYLHIMFIDLKHVLVCVHEHVLASFCKSHSERSPRTLWFMRIRGTPAKIYHQNENIRQTHGVSAEGLQEHSKGFLLDSNPQGHTNICKH